MKAQPPFSRESQSHTQRWKIVDGKGVEVAETYCRGDDEEMTDFIVRACNNHVSLLSALELAYDALLSARNPEHDASRCCHCDDTLRIVRLTIESAEGSK